MEREPAREPGPLSRRRAAQVSPPRQGEASSDTERSRAAPARWRKPEPAASAAPQVEAASAKHRAGTSGPGPPPGAGPGVPMGKALPAGRDRRQPRAARAAEWRPRRRAGRGGAGRGAAGGRRAGDELAGAAARGVLQRLRELLDGAADSNAANSYGRTPIQVGRRTVGSWARAAALHALPEAGGGSSGPSGTPEAAAPRHCARLPSQRRGTGVLLASLGRRKSSPVTAATGGF